MCRRSYVYVHHIEVLGTRRGGRLVSGTTDKGVYWFTLSPHLSYCESGLYVFSLVSDEEVHLSPSSRGCVLVTVLLIPSPHSDSRFTVEVRDPSGVRLPRTTLNDFGLCESVSCRFTSLLSRVSGSRTTVHDTSDTPSGFLEC